MCHLTLVTPFLRSQNLNVLMLLNFHTNFVYITETDGILRKYLKCLQICFRLNEVVSSFENKNYVSKWCFKVFCSRNLKFQGDVYDGRLRSGTNKSSWALHTCGMFLANFLSLQC